MRPGRSRATQDIATREINTILDEEYPDLRRIHRTAVVSWAIFRVFLPDPTEVQVADALNGAAVDDRERHVRGRHLIPRYGGPLGRVLAMVGFTMPAQEDF